MHQSTTGPKYISEITGTNFSTNWLDFSFWEEGESQ
jgi:hypothetical protein